MTSECKIDDKIDCFVSPIQIENKICFIKKNTVSCEFTAGSELYRESAIYL